MLPETLLTIDDILTISRISTNNLTLTLITSSLIKLSFISETQSAFLPTFRTVLRPWKIFFLIELLFLVNNKKIFSTFLTCFFLVWHNF